MDLARRKEKAGKTVSPTGFLQQNQKKEEMSLKSHLQFAPSPKKKRGCGDSPLSPKRNLGMWRIKLSSAYYLCQNKHFRVCSRGAMKGYRPVQQEQCISANKEGVGELNTRCISRCIELTLEGSTRTAKLNCLSSEKAQD